MKGRTAGFLMFVCVGLAAAGCYAGAAQTGAGGKFD